MALPRSLRIVPAAGLAGLLLAAGPVLGMGDRPAPPPPPDEQPAGDPAVDDPATDPVDEAEPGDEADAGAPEVLDLALTPARVRAGGAVTLGVELSDDATVDVVVSRSGSGRVVIERSADLQAGGDSVRVPLRAHGRPLPVGRYVVEVTPWVEQDAADPAAEGEDPGTEVLAGETADADLVVLPARRRASP